MILSPTCGGNPSGVTFVRTVLRMSCGRKSFTPESFRARVRVRDPNATGFVGEEMENTYLSLVWGTSSRIRSARLLKGTTWAFPFFDRLAGTVQTSPLKLAGPLPISFLSILAASLMRTPVTRANL